MPSVQEPRRQPEFVQGKNNTVIGIAEAQLFAVNWVNAEGQKSIALIIQFGKDTEDGGPGVYVLANEDEMREQLKIANVVIKKGVRQHLLRQQAPTAEEVPANDIGAIVPSLPVTTIDLGKMEGGSVEGDLDISKLNIG